jgi:Family of unknown function (DUF5694)
MSPNRRTPLQPVALQAQRNIACNNMVRVFKRTGVGMNVKKFACWSATLVFALHSSVSACAAPVAPPKKSAVPAPIQIMILGSYHMDSPGLDLINLEVDDVTKPKRQKELVTLTEQLAKFAPTKVAVEMVPRLDSPTIPAYEKFTPAELLKDKNEIVQIGFRLAHRMKHTAVYAIDEQSETVNYFPFDKLSAWAKANNQADALNALVAETGARVKAEAATYPRKTVSTILRETNDPSRIAKDQTFYTTLLNFGEGKEWPGADVNAAWYLRNAKIHAKLMKIAKPGDRIVVLYGSGHNYLLRDLVRSTAGFQLIEPRAYLR